MRDRFDINHAYAVLGLTPGTSQEQVKVAYRKLVKIWHPDRFSDPQQKQEAEEKIKDINIAYNKLKSELRDTANTSTQTSIHQVKISVQRWDAEAFYNSGVNHASQGKYEEAIADFSRAIRLNPDYVAAYKYRGFVCSQLGFEYRATSDLNKAAELEQGANSKNIHWRSSSHSRRATSSRPVFRRKSLLSRCCQQIKKLLKLNKH
jgi:curved DNA-binding protein CbpA